MMKRFGILFLITILPILILAQKRMIRGVVSDAGSGESLIGATIMYGDNKGVITDMDGRYYIRVDTGTYHLKVSYVGYLPQETDVTIKEADLTVDFRLKTPTLTEVEVVGDVARTRETPVAFSTVTPLQMQEGLASRDLPMILNKTPGVYATQQGGGDGDARINVRGFSQRNLAVMIDGIPVNDMQNGWVYWSNWFGLDAVTRNIQVQRGLGASKLALPSVGGTMNILSKGIDVNLGGIIRQEVGSDGFLRTSVGVTTGQLKHGWGFTVAGSYKQGDGWVDNTWTKGWFFYLRVDKKLGKHLLTFSAMGAPQQHAQRSYKKSIATFDREYAVKAGVRQGLLDSTITYGLRYNSNWGHLNRWTERDEQGNPIYLAKTENLSQSKNYYFKPQLSLRDFWRINDKFYWSNILYASIGSGGGTNTYRTNAQGSPGSSTFPIIPSDGLIDFQNAYDRNMNDVTHRAEQIIRSSVNNHWWFGLLSTFNLELNEMFTFSGGLDIRTYKGEHFGQVYDLLGGDFMRDDGNKNMNPYQTKYYEGDKIWYNDDGLVRWGGIFAQLEFKKGDWTAFLNLTTAISAYKRIDYFRKRDLVIDGNTFTEAVGHDDIFYYNGTQNLTYNFGDPVQPWTSHDTVFLVKQNGPVSDTLFIVNPMAYTVNSPEARPTQTSWKVFPGFTAKGGVNYNIDKRNNVFLNLGYLSKAPRFSNVFSNNNREYLNIKNEIIQALEIGYSYNSRKIGLNVNGYLTKWNNRPLDQAPVVSIDGDPYPVNINGIDALHKGIEIEFGWKLIPSLQWDQVFAWGDWRWTSGGTAYLMDPAGNVFDSITYNAKGVHVGDAAQVQLMESIRWEIIKYLYISGSFTLFAKNYSQFDPISLNPVTNPKSFDENGNPHDSWQIPVYYLVDLNAGYRFTFKNFKLDIRASVLNLFDMVYVSDAQNNDSYMPNQLNNFDASSASVFFGMGRRFNVSLAISY